MNSRQKDFLLAVAVIIALMPLFYFVSNLRPSPITLLIYFLILYPTLIALINGAPFVPTPMEAVEKMIKLADLKPDNKIYDIGCGDGRIVHMATKKYPVKGTGFEISPFVYVIARIRHWLWKSKAKIKFRNFKNQNLSDADAIFCYLLPETLKKLSAKLEKELKPGARVISYAFPISGWKEKEKITWPEDKKLCTIWVYVKP